MKNKLLLSTLVIASTINLSKVSASQTEIDYPMEVVAGATLNLASNENGYTVTQPIFIVNSTETVSNPITYNAPFSAKGSATLSFADVTFHDAMTLTRTIDGTPTMTVSGNMTIAGAGTIDTGDTTISFTGDNSQLDISDVSGVTFAKFSATGKDDENKLTINYGDADTVRSGSVTYYNNLMSMLNVNVTFTNTKIQNIWVTGGESYNDIGYALSAQLIPENRYSITVEDKTTTDGEYIPGEKFIADESSLRGLLAEKGVEILEPGDNDMDEDRGTTYTLDFGTDINGNIGGSETPYNSEGNVFKDWVDIEYDLDSNASGSDTGFTFNMDVQPDSEKTLQLKSTNPNLTTLTLNGEQNGNLTIKLKSAGIREVEFSPLKASYCKIDTSEAFDITKDSDDLNIKVLDAPMQQEFVINSVPIVGGQHAGPSGDITPTYSLTVGKNVNALLTSGTFNFNGITVDRGSGSESRIIVSGSDTTLNL